MRDKKYIKMDGITAILIDKNSKRVLFLKRRRFPFIVNPGAFSFVSGKRKQKEKHIQAALREIYEETKIKKDDLTLKKHGTIQIWYKNIFWEDKLFIFLSNTTKIRLNVENSRYVWIAVEKIPKQYLRTFVEPKKVVDAITEILG